MVLLIVLVFVGVFTVVALLIVASGSAAAGQSKQVLATLDSALASDIPKSRAPIVDFRKSELLSAIPWVNRGLLKSDLVPNLQRLLNQANLKWTVGVLLLLCAACFALPAYLIDLKTGSVLGGLLGGLVLGFLPYGYVRFLRSRRFGKFEEGLPDALELMVSALRVGHSFSAALGLVTRECADPIGCEFRICFERAELRP